MLALILILPYCKAVQRAVQNKASINDKDAAYEAYLAAVQGKSNNEAREIAADILGQPVFWDCDRRSRAYQFSSLTNLASSSSNKGRFLSLYRWGRGKYRNSDKTSKLAERNLAGCY